VCPELRAHDFGYFPLKFLVIPGRWVVFLFSAIVSLPNDTLSMPIANKKNLTKWPPVVIREGETDVEKKTRLQEEAEAKRISDQIDQQIEQDRQRRNKFKGAKVLLLGAHTYPTTLSSLLPR